MMWKMIDSLAVTIAVRHIIARRRQTALSVMAVALAVSISVIFTSLVTGQQQILTDLVEEKLPHVVVQDQSRVRTSFTFTRACWIGSAPCRA